MRMALVNLATNLVENVVEVVMGDGSSFPDGFKLVASDSANVGDTKAEDDSFAAPEQELLVDIVGVGARGVLDQIPTVDQQDAAREAAYRIEADWLFFKAQRGEVDISVWQKKVDEIKARFPYPVG